MIVYINLKYVRLKITKSSTSELAKMSKTMKLNLINDISGVISI